MRFLSCDWGSTTFRLSLVCTPRADAQAETRSGTGVSAVTAGLPADASEADRAAVFAAALAQGVAELEHASGETLDGVPVVISGMASSAHGWRELPYAAVPFAVDGRDLVAAALQENAPGSAARTVRLLSGVATGRDVMRGEEAQLVGLFSLPAWQAYADGCVVLLPGTHAKHVHVAGGLVTDFTTYMTGELFELLGTRSVLARTVQLPVSPGDDEHGIPADCRDAFRAGVDAVRRESLARSLFGVRVNGLYKRYTAEQNAYYLAGLLAGDELRDLAACGSDVPILLCAGPRLAPAYQAACLELGLAERLVAVPTGEVERLAAAGHAAYLARQPSQ